MQQLEAELQKSPPSESPSEVREDVLEEVHPQVQPIIHQRIKCEQALGPGGVQAGGPMVTEFTMYTLYTTAEL